MSHIFTRLLFSCRKSLEPLSQIVTVVLFFIMYLPMTTIATTHITDMWHFDKVAFGGF